MKLLLIEDDRAIATALAHALSSIYEVDVAHSGLSGLEKLASDTYAVIILDLSLPDISGIEVCARLRQNQIEVPVLILTGNEGVLNKISALDGGADDYLTKPVSLGELKARLRVLIRRSGLSGSTVQRLVHGELVMNPATREVSRAGQSITLQRKQFDLLECLIQHAGDVVSRATLTRAAWPVTEEPWENTVDVHIKYLRDKIDRPFSYPLIETVHGVGYRLRSGHPPAPPGLKEPSP